MRKSGLWAVLAGGIIGSLAVLQAHGADLRNFIGDLYGGNGIQLVNPAVVTDFGPTTLQELNALSDGISANVGQFGFNSSVSSFTFDISKGIPVRSEDVLGPVLAERALTVGKHRVNVGFTFTSIRFDSFEGEDLGRITRTLDHTDCCTPLPGFAFSTVPDGQLGPAGSGAGFEANQIAVTVNVKLEQKVAALFGTFGVTDNWDVGIIVPYVETEARATAEATVIRNDFRSRNFHQFGAPPNDQPIDRTGGEESGLGDIILRTKYNFLRSHETLPDSAVLGQLTLPTGDEDDLLGTGETAFQALYIGSKKYGAITPHVNLGGELSTDADRHNVRYVLGFDAQVMPQTLGMAVEVLGRYFPNQPSSRDHPVDLAFSAKWDPFKLVPLNFSAIIPVNHTEGLRSRLIWSVGIEHTF